MWLRAGTGLKGLENFEGGPIEMEVDNFGLAWPNDSAVFVVKIGEPREVKKLTCAPRDWFRANASNLAG